MKHLIKIALFLTTLTLIACGGSSGGGDPETPAGGGTPPAPTKTDLSITDAQGREGGNITFTVTSTQNIAKAISFRYQVNFTGAANASDLAGDTSGDITIATNDSNATISIAIFNDNFKEPAETFQIMLSNLSTSSADFTQNTAIGTIAESDPNGEIPITITNQSAAEGSSLNFKVTAGVTTTEAISFAYTIDFAGQTATASDLGSGQQLTGRETIATGDSSTTISIGIAEDTQTEPDETFRITLSRLTPSNATFDFDNRGIAIGTILASDPQISIANATSIGESNITFTVTANPPIAKQVTFKYNLVFDNPITLNSASTNDFSGSTSGEKTIAADGTGTTISIALIDDNFKEQAETFQIQLSDLTPTEATFAKSTATGTIAISDTDKATTRLTIIDTNAQGREGQNITFTVTATPPIAEPITFTFEATLDNKTTASLSDLTGDTSGQITIATNDSSTTISIAIKDDSLREADETFLVILSKLITPTDATFGDPKGEGKILANDENGIVVISVADATANENSGTINFKVSSAFSAVAGSPFTFDYESTVDNTLMNPATANDFDATTGMATISVDASSTTISISLTQDATAEQDETFRLLLTNLSNATLDSLDITNNYSATGEILNDDVSNVSDATARIGSGQITLNWTKPIEINLFAGVIIAQTTGEMAPANCSGGKQLGKITSHDATGLTNDTAYSFRICARSNSGSRSDGVTLANLTPKPNDDGDGFINEIDVDDDNDGLIEIATETEFNNVRLNLEGTGYKDSGTFNDGLDGNTTGCPNAGTGCNGYELVADIDLSGTWTPIGTFTATFDGNNNRISGLRISSGSNVGIFSILNNATIKNLKLANVDIDGGSNIGALAAQVNNSTISNIELIGDANQTASTTEINGTGVNVGGLVGAFRSGTIIDASSSLTIKGAGDNTGGLVGQFLFGSIKNSNSSGSVSTSGGADNVGGLVGKSGSGTTISNSWTSGNISSTGSNSNNYGGLVGESIGVISNSWASGNIVANSIGNNNHHGGLAGGSNGIISNSWASGNVTGNGLSYGGLVGGNVSLGSISQSWTSGEVTGTSNVGGLVGRDNGNINGRNYRLSDGGNSIGTKLATTDLAALSGASGGTGTESTRSNWHAGFGTANSQDNFRSRFCDTDGSGSIETSERVPTNSVWVMPSAANTEFPEGMRNSDNVTTTTNEAGGNQNYYQIPAIRCIANTAGITDTDEIDRLRKIEIDRQRRNFPQ